MGTVYEQMIYRGNNTHGPINTSIQNDAQSQQKSWKYKLTQ